MARLKARRERDQMAKIMRHAHINIWAVSKSTRRFTTVEGKSFFWTEENFGEALPKDCSLRNGDCADPETSVDGLALDKAPPLCEVLDCLKLSQEHRQSLNRLVDDVMQGEIQYGETEIETQQRHYKLRVVADIDPGVDEPDAVGTDIRGVLGCTVDISDMKARNVLEVENTRLQADEQLAKEQNRLKSQFLANMLGVMGMADLLLESKLTAEQRAHAECVQVSAQNLLLIINDILDFSRIEAGRLSLEIIPFSLAATIDNIHKTLSYAALSKGIRFGCVVHAPQGLHLLGDPGRIRQVLTNLLGNAIKFTNEGFVELTVRAKEEGDTAIVDFIVQDSGIGIEANAVAKLFQPFHQGDSTTTRLYGGTGLGLSISYSLINMMNGDIGLESQFGVGTKAHVSIPLKKAAAVVEDDPIAKSHLEVSAAHSGPRQQSPARPRLRVRHHGDAKSADDVQAGAPSAKRSLSDSGVPTQLETPSTPPDFRASIHVLLAEDNAINETIAVRAVRRLGFTVTAVANGREALDYLASNPTPDRPRAAVVLMDVQMPVMDGCTATRAIRSEPPFVNDPGLSRIPVIAMTASAIQGAREKCLEAGMDDYLSKPVQIQALENMLVKWTRRDEEG